jgi:hypothetical protein
MTGVWTTRTITLTGGWDVYTVPDDVNLLVIQTREAADTRIKEVPGQDDGDYFTLKEGQHLTLSSFNAAATAGLTASTLYFFGPADNHVEIIEQHAP